MYEKLQKNTAQYITFPLVDADGDFVTGATITGTYNYYEKGTAPQTAFIALTNAEVEIGSTGIYYVQLTAAETNHGYIDVMFTSATSKPQLLKFLCVVGNPELLATTAATDAIKTDTAAILLDTDTMEADLTTEINANETKIDTTITKIDAIKAETVLIVEDTGTTIPATITTMQADLDNPAQYKATGFSTHNADSVWAVVSRIITGGVLTTPNDYKATGFSVPNEYDTVIAALQTDLDNPDQYKASVAALALEATVAALNNISSSDVQTVLETNDLDHLIKVAHPTGDPVADSILDLIMNKDAGQTFARADDSLEAIRDRGDAEWVTGGVGGIDAIINVIPSIPKNIDLSNTKLVRLALYIIDSIDDLPTTAEITVGTITIDRSADGGTSWSNVVNAAACLEHAGCIYYDEVFDSGTGYASADMIRITFKGQKVTISTNDYEIADATDGMIFTTRIDSGLSGGGPSAGDIADAVWDEAIVDHTNVLYFGGKNQKVVPSETINDYKATGFSTHAAADIWSVVSRIITGGVLTTPNDYKASVAALALEATVAALNNITAADVWSEVSKVITGGVLTTPNDYKANITALATEANATTNKTAIITEVDANETKIDTLQTDMTAIKALIDNLPADTKDFLEQQLGLADKDSYIDTIVVDGSNRMTSCRKRIYNSKANAISHGVTGLLHTFNITVTYTNGDLASYLVTMD